MEETTLIDFNRSAEERHQLVAIYPAEGTFYLRQPADHPDAPWVTDQQKAAGKLVAYLAPWPDQSQAWPRGQGFRTRPTPASPRRRSTRPHGVDPNEPTRLLSLPEPRVLAKVRRPGDRTASRRHRARGRHLGLDERREQARPGEAGPARFLTQLSPTTASAWSPSTTRCSLVRRSPISRSGRRAKLQQRVNGLFPDGGPRSTTPPMPACRTLQQPRTTRRTSRSSRAHRRRGQQATRSSNELVAALKGDDREGTAARARLHDRLRLGGEPGRAEGDRHGVGRQGIRRRPQQIDVRVPLDLLVLLIAGDAVGLTRDRQPRSALLARPPERGHQAAERARAGGRWRRPPS